MPERVPDLNTNDVDLAAYCLARGIVPSTYNVESAGFVRWLFVDVQIPRMITEYWDNSPVPIQRFLKARAALKAMKRHGFAALDHYATHQKAA